jgi:hypothetical protein
MFQIDKPLPAVTEDGAPYWAACREHKLAVQRCAACGHGQPEKLPTLPRFFPLLIVLSNAVIALRFFW